MSDELQIPIGADLSSLQQSFAEITNQMSKVAQSTNATLSNMSAGLNRSVSSASAVGSASRISKAFESVGASVKRAMGSASGAARRTFGAIASAASRASSMIGRLFASMVPSGMSGMVGGVGGLVAALGSLGIAWKGIGAAAEIEGLETAFIPLLGSVNAATARIEELSRFAASTPFELPGIAKASRTLEVLTQGALSTGKGLELVGDVAAATQTPFEEIAMWIGRLYDGLQSGRPVGEAMARLQELGAVSGDVRSRIEALQKSNASGNETWNVAAAALGKFSGTMKLQSGTWNGLLSTLRDNIRQAWAAFGSPLMDVLKPYLASAAKMAETLSVKAAEYGQKIGNAVRMMQAVFSSGQLGNLVFASLKLAFSESVNFLYAAFRGTLGAVGQWLIEVFRNGISVMSILTTGDFWKGLGNALIGAFLDAVGFLQRGLRDALELARPLAELFGKGDSITSAQDTLTQSADILRGDAQARYDQAGIQLGPQLAKLQERMNEAASNITDRFMESFEAAGKVIDTTGLRKDLESITGKVRKELQASLAAEASKTIDVPATAAPAKPDAFGQVGRALTPAVTSLGRVGGGGFGSFSPMVSEQKRTNKILDRIDKNTGRAPGAMPVVA